jgi:hypothetical protein
VVKWFVDRIEDVRDGLNAIHALNDTISNAGVETVAAKRLSHIKTIETSGTAG